MKTAEEIIRQVFPANWIVQKGDVLYVDPRNAKISEEDLPVRQSVNSGAMS